MAVSLPSKVRRPSSRHPRRDRQVPGRRPTGFWHQAGLYLTGGVASTLAQAGLFLLLREFLGALAANLIAVAVTTMASTEFHRQVTFAGSPSAASRRWVQSGLTFTFYASYNSVVLLVLTALVNDPSPFTESATLTAFAVLGGISRFLLMRWWVFLRSGHEGDAGGATGAVTTAPPR